MNKIILCVKCYGEIDTSYEGYYNVCNLPVCETCIKGDNNVETRRKMARDTEAKAE